jgi:hypothetical protein
MPPVNREQIITELRTRAAKCRAYARQSDDDEEAHEIFQLAAQLGQQARDLEQSA